jgi:hypothetical protein
MADWRSFCRNAKNMRLGTDWVDVLKNDGRKHRIYVADSNDAYLLSGIVVRRSVLNAMHEPFRRVWQRNRAMQLVGFRVNSNEQIVGEALVIKDGLTREEFLLYLRRVAIECDQLEYQLTGKDDE